MSSQQTFNLIGYHYCIICHFFQVSVCGSCVLSFSIEKEKQHCGNILETGTTEYKKYNMLTD